jgi:formylglycine-generating enzyme required for sulfatase activity
VFSVVVLTAFTAAAYWYFGVHHTEQRRAKTELNARTKADAIRLAKAEADAEVNRLAEEAAAAAKAAAKAEQTAKARAEATAMALAAVVPDPVAFAAGQRWTNTLGMVFAAVPGVPAFSIWETRVADYAAYAAASSGVYGSWKNPGFTQTDQHPVVNVSWQDAQAFCTWLTEKERGEGKLGPKQSYRLPADWEWSVAVGLTESRTGTPKDKDEKTPGVYPWGKQWPPPKEAGNYASSLSVDSYAYTSPVGSFTANSFGLYDLGGNVWEWCEDWYDSDQKYRVFRGGSCGSDAPARLSCSCRGNDRPYVRDGNRGFRCVVGVVGSAPR